MTAYVVIGNPGAGKSLVCIGRIKDAIAQGRRVATNLNLRLEHLTQGGGPTHVWRVPDLPTIEDLLSIGNGNPTMDPDDERVAGDEKMNGLLVLDEVSGILDSRGWQSPERAPLIDWLKHHRKHGWDIYFIVQSLRMLDAQAREAFCEQLVVCKRTDRLPIPFIGWFLKLSGLSGKFLRAHIGTVRYGTGPNSVVSERWWYRGKHLFPAYDTRQVFRPQRSRHLKSGQPDDNPQGIYQCLDRFRAPWLYPQRGWRWKLAERLASRPGPIRRALYALWQGRQAEPGTWFDFWMAEKAGPPRYKPGSVSFSEWASGQAGHPGALGGQHQLAGEAPEPDRPERVEHMQQAA